MPLTGDTSIVDSPMLKLPEPGETLADLFESDHEITRRDFGERYEFVKILGEGGQGIVVVARDNVLEREVAIKALKKRADPAHIQMLSREARIGATLEHPNILPTYDLGADEIDSPLLIMRKIEGQSLEERLRALNQTAPNALQRERWKLLNTFIVVLHAIEFAHSRGVLHLDLKPANVSLGAHGEVYVIDWGFARHKNEVVKNRVGGTVHYVSPERLDGKIFDERADIFALGVILYRLLTGYHPRNIGRISFADYRKKWRDEPIVPIRLRDKSIAPELAAITEKAMAENPDERYQSVREMLDDLGRFLEMLPVSAYRDDFLSVIKRQCKKHLRSVIAASVILISAVFSGYSLFGKFSAEQYQRQTENEKRALEINEQRIEQQRLEQMRVRYEARGVLKRANDLLQRSRAAVETAITPEEKNTLLAPLFNLFAKAEQIDPTYAEIYDLRAQAHKLGRNWLDALRDYERAYQLDSSYLLALYEAGMLLADIFQQPAAAREKFDLMKTVSPNDEYAELGQAQIDIYEADRLLKLPPQNRDYAERSRLAADLYDAILTRLEKIENLNPALIDIWYLRGLIYQKSPRRRSPEKALAAYNRYLTARLDSPSAFHNRGDAKKDLGDIDGALADYSAALTLNPDFVWALRNRGYLLYKEKAQPELAFADINRAIEIAPQIAWSYVDRGAVYEGTGNYGAAERDYDYALTLEANNARIWYRLGVARFEQQQFAAAEKAFNAALWRFGDDEIAAISAANYARGLTRLANANYADAIADLEGALTIRRQQKNSDSIYPVLARFIAFKFLGESLDGNDFGAQLSAPADKPWLIAIGSYFLGEAAEEDVLRLANDPLPYFPSGGELNEPFYHSQKKRLLAATNPQAVCEARFYLGAFALANGDSRRAATHFQIASDSGARLHLEYPLAQFLLKKLREKPAK